MVRARCCFDIRRVMRAMVRTYQITMGRAYYKCTLRFSSTSNVTDTAVFNGPISGRYVVAGTQVTGTANFTFPG